MLGCPVSSVCRCRSLRTCSTGCAFTKQTEGRVDVFRNEKHWLGPPGPTSNLMTEQNVDSLQFGTGSRQELYYDRPVGRGGKSSTNQ